MHHKGHSHVGAAPRDNCAPYLPALLGALQEHVSQVIACADTAMTAARRTTDVLGGAPEPADGEEGACDSGGDAATRKGVTAAMAIANTSIGNRLARGLCPPPPRGDLRHLRPHHSRHVDASRVQCAARDSIVLTSAQGDVRQ